MVEYSQKWHNGTFRTRSTKTSNGLAAIQAQLNNLGREIKKVNDKVYAAQVGCKQCKGSHYTKDCPLKEEGKTLEEAYYTQFGAPFQGGGYRATALGFYQRNNANPSYQERSFSSSTKTNPKDHVKSISTTVEADASLIRRIGSSQYAVSTGQNSTLMYETRQMTIPFPSHLNDCYCEEKKGSYGLQFLEAYSYGASHINKSIPRKEKDPGSFTLPCYINNVFFDNSLADLGSSISVMPLSTYLNLGLGELAHTKLIVELADKTVKYPKGIAENVLVGIGKFVFPIDFIILNMPEDIKVPLILRRPFLSTAHAKIDVFKKKITLRVGEEKIILKSVKPASSLIKRVYMLSLRERMELDLEARLMGETLLKRDQVDDLMQTIEEGKVVEEFRAKNDARLVSEIFGYPSDCDHDKKIHIDCAHSLKFSSMIDFAILEDMDAYHDEGMGDVIFGDPFLREVGINARRFEGMITIYNCNEEVTYQMVRSHPRFEHHTNGQCNKISPLLKDLAGKEIGEYVDVRTYLLGGAIDSSEANGIIRDPKLELVNSCFTFDLVPLSYESVNVVVGENWLLRHKGEMVCHEKVVKMPWSCKLRVGSNGNLLWEASILLGRNKGCVMDMLKFTAMPFGLTNAPAVFMELMSQVAHEDDRGVSKGREDVREVFQQCGSGAKRKLSRCGRNQMGKEPILALPEGADNFVVYYDARSKDLEACLEKGRG
ncbi:mitochondrial proton/calcium exchanger protein-like protein isoform X1 [Tanacetum coccineum]